MPWSQLKRETPHERALPPLFLVEVRQAVPRRELLTHLQNRLKVFQPDEQIPRCPRWPARPLAEFPKPVRWREQSHYRLLPVALPLPGPVRSACRRQADPWVEQLLAPAWAVWAPASLLFR